MSERSQGGDRHSYDSYSSDDFEQELPGESSTLPLQQQAAANLEHHSAGVKSGISCSETATATHTSSSEATEHPPADDSQPENTADASCMAADPQELKDIPEKQIVALSAGSPPAAASIEHHHNQTNNNDNIQQQSEQQERQPEHHQRDPHHPIELPSAASSQSLSSPQAVLWGHPSPASPSAALTAAAVSPQPPAGRPSYSELSLRSQALEVALDQQQQHSAALQQALAAAHAAHSEEEASMRQYYEAQLADRQQEVQLLVERLAAQQAAAAAAPPGSDGSIALSPDGRSTAAAAIGSRTASPWPDQQQQQQQQQQQPPPSASPRPQSHGRQQQRNGAMSSSINSALAAAAASGGFSLADFVILRRELAQAEQLLTGYQAENAAAAKRIKDLEVQLMSVRASLADEAARAQRAAAAAADAHRVSGAAAADRLARQLHLEGLLEQQAADWADREKQLMNQIDELRRDKAAAEARAAAAAQGVDTTHWQAEDGMIAELRDQLSAQSAAHQQQLSDLKAKLSWYVENQQLISQSDDLVKHQAEVIRKLENRVQQLEGAAAAAGGGAGGQRKQAAAAAAAARIAELEQQVHGLKQLLASRHPSSLPAAAIAAAAAVDPGEPSSALTAAQTTIRHLEQQLDLQQQQHDHGLRSLQQQYEALKMRLEQRQAKEEASASSRGRIRELTQQLEDHRKMSSRKIRELEAKLTAAEGAAAAATRRASGAGSSSSRGRAAGRVGLRAAGKAESGGTTGAPGRQSRRGAAASAAANGAKASSNGADGDQQAVGDLLQHADDSGQQQQPSSPETAAAAGGEGGTAASACVMTGLLHVKQRQLIAVTAQLEERTSQFLQIQQKLRAAEKQIKQLTATSGALPGKQASTDIGLLIGDAADDETTHPVKDIAARARRSTQHKLGGTGAAAAVATGTAAASSWPALCAELEHEVDALKAELIDTQQQLAAARQQQHQLQEQQQQQGSLLTDSTAGTAPVAVPSIPLLVSVAEEAAARSAAQWREKVRWLEEALQNSHAEVSSLKFELKHCRAQGKWTPTAAAFEALENKINSLEAAQRQRTEYRQQQQHLSQTAELQLVVQRYEQLLAVRDAELKGFRAQVDALLSAAQQLQRAP